MDHRRSSRIFLISAIVALAAIWLTLRFVLDVPLAVVTIVLTALGVVSVVLWNLFLRRARARRHELDD